MPKFRGRSQSNTSWEPEKKTRIDSAEVARVAYQLYEQRGRKNGHDLDDWLKAEAIVNQRKAQGIGTR